MKRFFNLSSLIFNLFKCQSSSMSHCLSVLLNSLCAFMPLCLLFLFPGCQQGVTPFPFPVVTLTAVDVGVTDATIKFIVTNTNEPEQISIERDGKEIKRLVRSGDSLFYDDDLMPNHSYTYKFYLLDQEKKVYGTGNFSVTTLDTTSHEFEWESFAFGGQGGSSSFFDVAIINEDDIWAVGELYVDTSSVNTMYNVAHWDGISWQLMQFKFYDFCNQSSMGIYPAKAIIAFNSNDIWISSGSQITHWNGSIQTRIECIPASVLKLWGTDNQNIYAVGYSGKIAHYDGNAWQTIESDTDLPIQDIWGLNNDELILCVANEKYEDSAKKILKILPDLQVDEITYPFTDKLHSIWFNSTNRFYVAGSSVMQNRQGQWKRFKELPNYFKNCIRGNGLNDIFVCGDYGFLAHYNGVNWHIYNSEPISMIYRSLCTMNNVVAAVGDDGVKGIVTIGKRIN